jgi:hypothetical protein
MRLRSGFEGVAIVVIAAAVLATGGIAVAQQATGGGSSQDVRPDIYNGDDILSTVTHALPAFIAVALALILLMRFLGVFEMGFVSVLLVLAAIGTIVWKYYWLPAH